jgi:hypothetical protein
MVCWRQFGMVEGQATSVSLGAAVSCVSVGLLRNPLLGNTASQNGPSGVPRTILRGPATANMAFSTVPQVSGFDGLRRCTHPAVTLPTWVGNDKRDKEKA